MNILNGQEAFTALMAGKNIMCRAIGELIEFNDLDQFPATVFAMPGYEFAIKIDEISINGYTFLKPYSLEELSAGQDVFLLGNTGTIVKGQFIPEYEELVLAVKNGSVQRDFENAQNQAKAMQSLLGITNDLVLKVVDFHEFMKPVAKSKKTTRKKFSDSQTENLTPEVNAHKNDQENTSEPAPKTRLAFTVDEVAEIEIDPTSIIEKFAAQIASCKTTEAVLSLRPVFFANGHLEREHTQQLCKLTEEKLLELDPEQYAPKVDDTPEITDFNEPNTVNLINTEAETELKIAQLKEEEYQKLLSELLERAKVAKTPAEANALYKYTTQWTEEQRKPLMQAITKRLQELNQHKEADTEQPPSLMVRILNTRNEHELNELLPEIRSRHPDIQPKLMDLVKKRRFELENQGSQVAS